MRAAPLAALLVLASLAAAPPALAQGEGPCPGDFEAAPPAAPHDRAMRFGVTPSGAAGQLGPVPSPFAPDDPQQILAALERLRPPHAPFVAHVYSSWEDEGPEEDARLSELAERYTGAGHEVEFVLRYKPKPEREGDVAGYVEWVRHMVRLLGANPRVVAFQITNEVNFTISPDSSDGAYEGARDALIQGVIAAKDEARARGRGGLEIGFNWVYRLDPDSERSFWGYLRDHGGPHFLAALSWIGLDAYPGTFFPPAIAPGEERRFMVNALSTLRECYAPIARIAASTPIHVQENGFPTGPGRSYERQAEALRNMVLTVHEQRRTYNVSDYRWFNMRDADTESPNFQQQYGLMTDAYVPKPAFEEYERLVDDLAAEEHGGGPVNPPRPRIKLRLTYWRGRDARDRRCSRGNVRAVVTGSDRDHVRSVRFRLGSRRLRRDRRPPFAVTLPVSRLESGSRGRISALIRLHSSREVHARRFRRC